MQHAPVRLALIIVPYLLFPAAAQAASYRELTLPLENGGVMGYAISVPDEAAAGPRPLVLALHPGGERMPRYGSMFARGVVLPAIDDLKAIVVAPDCPTERWAEPGADAALMRLVASVMTDYDVDRRKVLIIGFSMGGRGTWYMASRHPELFTGAIPMAASIGDETPERLATMPTYVIHSRADTVVPFAPAEKNAKALERLGRPVKFEALDGLPHFNMGGYVPSLRRAVRWIADRWAA